MHFLDDILAFLLYRLELERIAAESSYMAAI
jgi:hypothetical protein